VTLGCADAGQLCTTCAAVWRFATLTECQYSVFSFDSQIYLISCVNFQIMLLNQAHDTAERMQSDVRFDLQLSISAQGCIH
jgi:hypothetical protein